MILTAEPSIYPLAAGGSSKIISTNAVVGVEVRLGEGNTRCGCVSDWLPVLGGLDRIFEAVPGVSRSQDRQRRVMCDVSYPIGWSAIDEFAISLFERGDSEGQTRG